MNKNLTNLLVLLVLVWPGIVAAQSTSSIPSVPLTAKTISVQNKAEQLFEERNYDRAFFIYRNELAPIGDKYSQYMVGFMYLTGKGVEPSRVMATAWYRLAAERGTREFETVRDQLMVSLTPEQKGECDGRYVALRKQYGDLALLMKAVRSDFETLSSRTGNGRIQDRLKARLEYIASQTNAETGDLDSMNLSSIERLVNEHLEAPE
jgi:TPR repeat protein